MQESNLLMYTTEDGLTKIEATFVNDTVWLSLEKIAELFQRDKSTVSRHIKNFHRRRIKQRVSCCKICNNCFGWKNLSGGLL